MLLLSSFHYRHRLSPPPALAAGRQPAPRFKCRRLYGHSVIDNQREDQWPGELGNHCYSLVTVLLKNVVRRRTISQINHDLDSDYDPARSPSTLNARTTPRQGILGNELDASSTPCHTAETIPRYYGSPFQLRRLLATWILDPFPRVRLLLMNWNE